MSSFRQDPSLTAPPSILKNLMSSNSFKMDEGYSEDTRSQSGSDVAFRNMEDQIDQDQQIVLPEGWAAASEEERLEFVYILMRGLRTSSMAEIVDRLHPLLHLDPVLRLPNEIMFDVLGFLDTQDLLRASTLSKMWRTRALDSELWRNLFKAEGWNSDIRGVREHVAAERSRLLSSKGRKMRGRPSLSDIDPHVSKKRAGDRDAPAGGSLFREPGDGRQAWREQQGQVEADQASMSDADEKMEDILSESTSLLVPDEANSLPAQLSPPNQLQPPLRPRLLVEEHGKDVKMNWQFLYKQKKRLEENWNSGNFSNFQLPHPAHPEEGHAQCVYTIQYSPNHLVSGSRDHTIKIWDLETQRLKFTLKGHAASVLCLQFDERPEHDLVASGGSDTHVLIWRFSTGQLIKRLDQAHAESVLNLRFDERFLVTCSKDKTIKVWNRRALLPEDADYPGPLSPFARYPSYILDTAELDNQIHTIKPIKEFNLLMTLLGHTAAVNAIQVLDGQVVSASGDRTVKLWDIKSGVCLKTITGHLKGIACVQYDGRRIVSGSSDDSVRIFDRATSAEVACLRGHSNLVRTVQARFGDVHGNDDELEAEAQAVDRRFFEAQANGQVPASRELKKERRRARNAGSSDPREICAWGAKIPPGGGGTRWARIVSGSYDESVIIWRRNAEGRWVPLHRLNQLEAIINAGGRPRTTVARVVAHPPPVIPAQTQADAVNGGATQGQQQTQQIANQSSHAHATVQQTHHNNPTVSGQAPAALYVASQTPAQQSLSAIAGPSSSSAHPSPAGPSSAPGSVAGGSSNPSSGQPPQQNLPHHPGAVQLTWSDLPQPQTQIVTATASSALNTAPTQPQIQPQAQQGQQAQAPNAIPHQQPQPQTTPQHSQQSQAPAPPHQHQHQHQQPLQQQQQQAAPPHPNPHHHHHHHHQNPRHEGNNSRVFKLQFDSRRIICCSQNPTIVGWDFANGDEEIAAASRFFGEEM